MKKKLSTAMNPLAMKWKGGELIAPIKKAALPGSNWTMMRVYGIYPRQTLWLCAAQFVGKI